MRITTYLTGIGIVSMAVGFVMPVYGQSTAPATTTTVISSTTTVLSPEWPSQDAYWQENYTARPYYISGLRYDAYRPAYLYGVNTYAQAKAQPYATVAPQLENNWNAIRGTSNLTWTQAEPAVHDAYDRMYNSHPHPAVVAITGPIPSDTVKTTAGAGETTNSTSGAFSSTGTTLGR